MPTFRVDTYLSRRVSFYVEADSREAVTECVEALGEDWNPGDVEGLIDTVGEEELFDYEIDEVDGTTVAYFRVNPAFELEDTE